MWRWHKVYNKFKVLLEEAEFLGKVVTACMYETYASIEIIDDEGRKISLSMTIKED
jgi:hypothetical protein